MNFSSLLFDKSLMNRSFVHIQTALEEIEYLVNRNQKPRIQIEGVYTDTGKEVRLEGQISKIEHKWANGIFSLFVLNDSGEEVSIGGIRAQYENITASLITILP